MCEGLCHVSHVFFKLSMVTGPEQVVNRFLIPLLHFFFSPLPSLSQEGPEGAVSGPVGLGGRALSSLQHLPFFHGPPGVPRSPIKRSSLTSPAQVPCPTGQFHFCSQPGFQAPSPPVNCTPGTPFLPEADDHLLEIRLFCVLLAQRCPEGPFSHSGTPAGPPCQHAARHLLDTDNQLPGAQSPAEQRPGPCWTLTSPGQFHYL